MYATTCFIGVEGYCGPQWSVSVLSGGRAGRCTAPKRAKSTPCTPEAARNLPHLYHMTANVFELFLPML